MSKWIYVSADLTANSNQIVLHGLAANTIELGWIVQIPGHDKLLEVTGGTALDGNDDSILSTQENYTGSTSTNVNILIIPSVADLVSLITEIKAKNQAHTSLLANLYNYTNTTGTVTFTDAAGGQVTLDTLPKIINDFQTQDPVFNTASINKASGSAYFTVDTGSASDTGVLLKENGTNRFRMENVAASDFLGFYNYATANYDFKLNYDGSTEVTSLKTQDATIEGTTRINSAAGADAEIEIIEGGDGGGFGTAGNDGYRIQSVGSSNVLKIQTGVGTTIKDVFVINRVTGNIGAGGNPSASAKFLINGDLAMAGTIFSLGTFIISTLPAASAYPNGVAKVTNDVNGHVLVMSNGTIWRRVFDNNAPST